ncbi:MAG TPA: hypothetical protein VFR23_04235 [Jiangellaceae bacterium]|nr:hypothetical protein [Jiangellaceae bacterium]
MARAADGVVMNINPEDLEAIADKAREESRTGGTGRMVAILVVREINHLVNSHQGPPLACKECERYVAEKFKGGQR